jgi:hypothetical protein
VISKHCTTNSQWWSALFLKNEYVNHTASNAWRLVRKVCCRHWLQVWLRCDIYIYCNYMIISLLKMSHMA